MYVDQILEIISKFPEESYQIPKYWLIESLRTSAKFHLGEIPGAIDNLLAKQAGAKIFSDDLDFPLPFPATFLSFIIPREKIPIEEITSYSTRRGVLAVEDKQNGRTLYLQYMYYDEGKMWVPSFFGLVHEKDQGEFKIAPVIKNEAIIRNTGRNLKEEEIRAAFKSLNSDVSVFNVFLELLTCKNITTETIHIDEKLNRKRIKNGKLPLFEYKVLNLLLPGVKSGTGLTSSKELGATQRVHLCRGHFKEYTKERPLFGKYTGRYWWQSAVRGKGAGCIVKDYHVDISPLPDNENI